MNLFRLVKHDLPHEVKGWVAHGIIAEHQAEKILALYNLRFDPHGSRLQGYSVLSVLGLLFIGLGILVAVGRNWEEIPAHLRLFGLVAATLLMNLQGIRAWRQGDTDKANNYLFLGALIYGASIFLIAQTFHLAGYAPTGILWWIAGTAPLLLSTRASRFAYLHTFLATTYLIMEGIDGYVPALYLPAAALTGWFILKVKESKLLFMLILCGSVFLAETAYRELLSQYRSTDLFLLHFQFGLACLTIIAMAMGLAGQYLGGLSDYLTVARLWLARLGFILMFVLSFSEIWDERRFHDDSSVWCWAIVSVVTLFVWAGLFTAERLSLIRPSLHPIDHAAVWVGVSVSTVFACNIRSGFGPELCAVAINVLIVGLAAWLILSSIEAGRINRILAGAAILGALGFIRYIDLIGDYVGAAILFVVQGIALVCLARFVSRQKQEVVR